jgi:N-acetylglucosamine-6-phosphate deacetylase
MDQGVRNLMEFTGSSLKTAVAAASRNPSTLMGIDDKWGTLEVGRPANITVLSQFGQVLETMLAGQPTLIEAV